MKKRLISSFLVVAMLLTLVSINTYAAEQSLRINKSTIAGDETITVTYVVPNSVSVASLGVKISFDKDKLEAQTITWNSIAGFATPVGTNPTEANASGNFAGSCTSNTTDNTSTPANLNLVTAVFKIKDASVNGTANFTVVSFTASDEAGDGKETETGATMTGASITITAPPVTVTGVTVTPETKELTAAGKTFTVSATVDPETATNQKVTFSSNNTAVATVNATTGVVTAVANGTAIITATTEDGGKTDTCTVTVNIPHVHVWVETPAKASTCMEKGNNQYFYCSSCHKYYKADKTAETTVAAETLPLAAHTLTHHDAVAATHFATGNIEYWTCDLCGKYFTNAAGTTETTAAAVVTGIIPHNYGTEWEKDNTNHWHECGCGNKIDTAAHTFNWVVDTAATEEATGLKHEECTVCGYTRSAGTVIPKLDHTHVWVETSAKASTCMEKGNNQYFYCSSCHKYYKADKTTETTVAAETLPLAAHDYGDLIPEVAATHNSTSLKAHYQCSVCNKYFDADKNETTLTALTIATIPHNYGTEWEKDNTNHWHECGCGSIIDNAAHTYGEWDEITAPTETAKGEKEHTCTVCGYVETVEIPELGHTHTSESGWTIDKTGHWHICNDCTEPYEKAAHSYGEWTVTKEATATEPGSKEHVCSVCGYKETVEIAKTTAIINPNHPTSPKTGDNSNLILWITIMTVAGVGIVGVTVYSRKKKRA